MIERVELKAIRLAHAHFTAQGYTVEDVSRDRKHIGYDFLIERNGARETVEVKGCSRAWQIPDLFATEVHDGRLVADKLCVVYLIPENPVTICVIPRDVIAANHFREKRGYRISGTFKKEAHLGPYLEPFAGPAE